MAGKPAGGWIMVGRPPLHRMTLWASMLAVLGASWAHVARVFGTLEESGPPAFLTDLGPAAAVLAALGLDGGLISLAWAIGQRRRLGRSGGDLWAAVAVFAALSAFANADAALRVTLDTAPTWAAVSALDGWTLARVVLLAAALPALALWLSRVVELDAENDGPAGLQDQKRAARAEVRALKKGPAVGSPTVEKNGGRTPVRTPKKGTRRTGPDDLADLVAARPTIDVAAAARALGVTRPTVYAWAEEADLARDDGGRWHNGKG